MDFVYLKWYDVLYDVIYNWFIEPLWNLIKNAFLQLMELYYEWVLQPLYENIMKPLWMKMFDTIAYYICKLLYRILAGLFHLIDVVEDMFHVFSGTGMVSYHGEDMTLLSALMSFDQIKKVFWYINFMAFTLTFLFAVYAVVKSTLDFDFENRRPVSRVVNSLIRSMLSLWTIQFFIYFMLELSSVILTGLNTAMQRAMGGAGETSMGRTLFVIASVNAAKETALNMDGSRAVEVGPLDPVRRLFYQTDGGYSYSDIDAVESKFYIDKFNYLIGFVLAIFVLAIMLLCMVIFIQRILDLIVLYVVAPLFVSTIPLDDGEKFAKWRELFIGKCFTGYGMVVNMQIYLMIASVVMGGSLSFSASPETNFFAKALFMVGGLWAVYKSGSMITRLLSQDAGMMEQSTARAAVVSSIYTYQRASDAFGRVSDGLHANAKNYFAGKLAERMGGSYGQKSIPGVGQGRNADTSGRYGAAYGVGPAYGTGYYTGYYMGYGAGPGYGPGTNGGYGVGPGYGPGPSGHGGYGVGYGYGPGSGTYPASGQYAGGNFVPPSNGNPSFPAGGASSMGGNHSMRMRRVQRIMRMEVMEMSDSMSEDSMPPEMDAQGNEAPSDGVVLYQGGSPGTGEKDFNGAVSYRNYPYTADAASEGGDSKEAAQGFSMGNPYEADASDIFNGWRPPRMRMRPEAPAGSMRSRVRTRRVQRMRVIIQTSQTSVQQGQYRSMQFSQSMNYAYASASESVNIQSDDGYSDFASAGNQQPDDSQQGFAPADNQQPNHQPSVNEPVQTQERAVQMDEEPVSSPELPESEADVQNVVESGNAADPMESRRADREEPQKQADQQSAAGEPEPIREDRNDTQF